MPPTRDLLARARLLLQQAEDGTLGEALSLLAQAVAHGEPDALLLQAHLLAAGVSGRADWDQSIALLVDAASRGSQRAQDELALLAGTDGPPGDLAARINIRDLVAPRTTETVSESPRVRTARQFLTPRECAWMIANAGPRLKDAQVYDSTHGGGLRAHARTNRVAGFSFAEIDLALVLFQARIGHTIGLPTTHFEQANVLHYRPGEEFRAHVDYLDSAQPGLAEDLARRGQRVATFLISLNDDYGGGETDFLRLAYQFKGSTGDALVFANTGPDLTPDPRTLHAGLAPTRGEKWIVSQWIRSQPAAQA